MNLNYSRAHETMSGLGLDANEILPNLYQGSEPSQGMAVRNAGFHVLVLCAMEIQAASRYPGLTVVKCPLDDDEDKGISDDEWRRAVSTASRLATYSRFTPVLVTCYLGLNRSGLVSALTCHFVKGWSGLECVERVRACRPGALDNRAFVDALATRLR